MKKTFLAKRNTILSSGRFSLGAMALTFSILVLLGRLVAPNIFLYTFTPLFKMSDVLSSESHLFFGGFNNASKLTKQNDELKNVNQSLANENRALLRRVAGISALFKTNNTSKNAEGILAGVVTNPPESPYDILVVSAGTKDGVALGMEAFGNGNVPIGIVKSVYANFSRVILFSSPNIKTHGWIGSTNTPITIIGAGGGAMNATVARSAHVVVGGIVFIPGPGMLPIGSVIRIDGNPLSPGVTLRIKPMINIFSTAWVTLRATGIALSTFATSTLQ